MNKKILPMLLLALVVLAGSFYAVRPGLNNIISVAEAKKKTKWQSLLERNLIPVEFWNRYRPKVTRKEYKKAIKNFILYQRTALNSQNAAGKYILHQNVTTTTFWTGEVAGPENGYIPNNESAWDEKWTEHFGGIDDPVSRNGYFPAGFTPLENPFYFALPYNDFNGSGNRKSTTATLIPWASEKSWGGNESMCKNRWIKIVHGGKTAYAQWQDVGPYEEDDTAYVFGSASPHSSINNHAGLDVSPAVRDYLGLGGMEPCDWQFMDTADVPDGPWKQIITTSNIYWE